jgi:hypothetical protein
VDPEWAAWGYFSLGLGGMDVKRERDKEEERTCGACSRIVGVFLVLHFFFRGAVL